MQSFKDIARLEEACFSDAWNEKSLEDTFEYDYNHLLLEKRDGRVIAYVIYSDIQSDAELLRIAVDKKYRRQGIASRLISDMIRELEDAGTDRVTLEVRAHNVSAVRLYKSLGFEEIFVRRNYYKEPEDDALIFQKNL